jgi:hypothetical protein
LTRILDDFGLQNLGQEVRLLYPLELLPILIRYVEEVWIPERAEEYFYERDRKALDYLPKLLPAV